MIPSGWDETTYPGCWATIVDDQDLLKAVSGGLSSKVLNACKKYGGLEKADLELALNPNKEPYLAVQLLTSNHAWVNTTHGECQVATVTVDWYEDRRMNVTQFNRVLLALIVMWGAWKTKPKFDQIKTFKKFFKAAFDVEGPLVSNL